MLFAPDGKRLGILTAPGFPLLVPPGAALPQTTLRSVDQPIRQPGGASLTPYKTMKRVTLYRDPINDREWIVATDEGDASEETVLFVSRSRAKAAGRAKEEARKAGCEVTEETVSLR